MPGLRKVLSRAVLVWLVTTVSIIILSHLLGHFQVDGWQSALGFAAVFGLLNSLVWPLLMRFVLPLMVLTVGLGVLLLNGLIVLIAAQARFTTIVISGLGEAIVVALGITILNGLLLSLLAVDDDDFYYLSVVRRRMNRQANSRTSGKPGVIFLEIDGLAHDVLVRAIRDGNAPTIAKWLHQGTHKLISWETDWSSQTGAMQAGILHGNNHDMPAFRWWEKDRQAAMVSNHPKDAMEIERRHSNGKGLLAKDGASRANLLSGDAAYSLLTMSTILKKKRPERIGQDYFTYFANPFNLLRTIALSIQEIGAELWYAGQQKRLDVEPRVHRGFSYSFLRAWTTVIQRDLQVEATIGDMLSGRPVAYTTFLGYDEVAHHSGIERLDALTVLRKIDKQFRRIQAAAAFAPRPYHLVVLSDHGQTQGATFLQRSGMSLEKLVAEACAVPTADLGGLGDEGSVALSASIIEAGRGKGFLPAVSRLFSRSKPQESSQKNDSNVKVMASGCLGLIYFTDIAGRANYETIENKYPGLINILADQLEVGFLLVRTKKDGDVVIGKTGKYFLRSGKVKGDNPLELFGPNAARHIKRTSGFKNCADIMINSSYWPMSGEVAAFEELVGSHGGLGGTQNHPFILYPSSFSPPKQQIIGAESVHRQLSSWLAALQP